MEMRGDLRSVSILQAGKLGLRGRVLLRSVGTEKRGPQTALQQGGVLRTEGARQT